MKRYYYSIGFLRDDYNFEILATLNNGVELFSEEEFNTLIKQTIDFFQDKLQGEKIVALPRQDSPDLVDLEDEELEEHFNITEAMLYEEV